MPAQVRQRSGVINGTGVELVGQSTSALGSSTDVTAKKRCQFLGFLHLDRCVVALTLLQVADGAERRFGLSDLVGVHRQ